MKPKHAIISLFSATAALLILAGCQSAKQQSSQQTAAPTAAVPTPSAKPATPVASVAAPAAPVATAAVATPASARPFQAVRIKAGPGESFKDADGNIWLPEQGFVDGETTERPDLKIENTKTPVIYLSEKYSMSAFTYPVPNGKYTIKLHFCETYEGITGPGERVFSFNVEGHDFKNFDIWARAGGFLRPCIISVPVDITDGKVDITFTPQVENPQICGIEILPGY